MRRAAMVHSFSNFGWSIDRPSGESVSFQRCARVLRGIFDEVYLAIYPHWQRIGHHANVSDGIYTVSIDRLPLCDALFFCEDYEDHSGDRYAFVEAAQTDNVFIYHFCCPYLLDKNVIKALIVWLPNFATDEIRERYGVPVHYHPMYIRPVNNTMFRWSVTGRGSSIALGCGMDIILEAILASRNRGHEVSILRANNLLLSHKNAETSEHTGFFHSIQDLIVSLPNASVYPDVGQEKYARLLSETSLLADLSENHSSPAIQEALVYGSQVIRTKKMNQDWIDDDDVLTIPDNILVDRQLTKEWLIDVFNDPPTSTVASKYRSRHSWVTSLQAMKNILEEHNVI